jgi:hypothetical protein
MKIDIARILLFLVSVLASILPAKAGAPINFIGYKSPSVAIFSKAGPTVINYQLYAQYDGIHKPGGGLDEGGFVVIVIKNSNDGFLTPIPSSRTRYQVASAGTRHRYLSHISLNPTS